MGEWMNVWMLQPMPPFYSGKSTCLDAQKLISINFN